MEAGSAGESHISSSGKSGKSMDGTDVFASSSSEESRTIPLLGFPDNGTSEHVLLPQSSPEFTCSTGFTALEASFSSSLDPELELYLTLRDTRENNTPFSRKVFIGGLPEGITGDEIYTFFSRFGELGVDWPHRETTQQKPRGFAFLIYNDTDSVLRLLESCLRVQDKLCICLSYPFDRTMIQKEVQVRPWQSSDKLWVSPGVNIHKMNMRYSVFLGGVQRTLTAVEIAGLLQKYVGPLAMVCVEVDSDTEYPKGAARLVFMNRVSYIEAVHIQYIVTQLPGCNKKMKMEMKPFLEDAWQCETCECVETRLFCADTACLKYFCHKCWQTAHHSLSSIGYHRPMQKGSASDQPLGGYAMSSKTSKSVPVFRQCLASEEYDKSLGNRVVENAAAPSTQGTCQSRDQYSRKMLITGIPEGVSGEELKQFFSLCFGEVIVNWPQRNKFPDYPPADFVFLVFSSVSSVYRLLCRCQLRMGVHNLLIPRFLPAQYKMVVQVHPWVLADQHWRARGELLNQSDPRLSVFLGGVPRTSTAYELASQLQTTIGDVALVSIETEPDTFYPKGTARAVFTSRDAYMAAIARRAIEVQATDQNRLVELKPFVEITECDLCHEVSTRDFCPDLRCLLYLCANCWPLAHDSPWNAHHQPLACGAGLWNGRSHDRYSRECGAAGDFFREPHYGRRTVQQNELMVRPYSGRGGHPAAHLPPTGHHARVLPSAADVDAIAAQFTSAATIRDPNGRFGAVGSRLNLPM